MYSIEDKNQLVKDLKAAAKDQDGRQISRLVAHGEDLKIISQTTAYTLRSLGLDLYNSTRKEGEPFAAEIIEIAEAL